MLKRILCLILSFALILSVNIPVFAETTNMFSVFVDTSNKTITVSGMSSSRYVSIYFLHKDKTIADISYHSEENPVLYNMAQPNVDTNGEYKYTFGYEEELEFTVCVCVNGTYVYKEITKDAYSNRVAGLGNIFGLPESFGALEGTTTKERFESARKELPSEMPIYAPLEIGGVNLVYVAPGATDGNGTIEKPFGNISDAVNAVTANPAGTVIYLRGGNYGYEQIAKFNNLKTNASFPLFISAYQDEEVVFTGGLNFEYGDFSKVTDMSILNRLPIHAAGNVLSVNLKEMGITSYASVSNVSFSADGEKYTLARWPDIGRTGMLEYKGSDGENGVIDSGSITVNSGSTCGSPRANGIKGEPGFEIVVADTRPFTWKNTDNIWVSGAFYEEWSSDTVRIKEFNADTQSIRTYTGCSWGAKYKSDNGFYYFNILEEMDKPGEWFLDRETGILYLYPQSKFSNATLCYNSATLLTVSKSSNIVFNGIRFKDSAGSAIEISNSENILVQNCTFDGNAKGVSVTGASKFCGVINSVFSNITGTPIAFSQPAVTDDIMVNLKPQYNFIQNNYIYGCGNIVVRGNANIVSHNTVSNSIGSGIYSDRGHEVIIEYNEVAYGNRVVKDSGAIYVGGNRLASGGNHVRYNYIHHNGENRPSPYGIYFDDFMSRSYIYGNVMEGTKIFLHNGSDNTVYNNVIVGVINGSAAIHDSQNYYNDGFASRWKTGALEYGAYTEFLDPNQPSVYIDVISDNSAYAIRYPALKDWAVKMNQRIAEYKKTGVQRGSEINVTYPNGTVVDLDEYLRSPRYNYYDKNVMIGSVNKLNICTLGAKSAITGNNAQYISYLNPFSSGYTSKNCNYVRYKISDFENVSIDKAGVLDDMKLSLKAATPCFPSNGQITDANDIGFKWNVHPGNTINTIEIFESSNMSKPIITEETRDDSYVLTDAQKQLLQNGKTYYWHIKSKSGTVGIDGSSITSPVYSFTINDENLEYTGGGFLIQSITDGEGNQVNALTGKTILNVSAIAYNKAKTELKDVVMYAAAYDNHGVLLKVKPITVPVLGAESYTDKLTFELKTQGDVNYIKLFMWDKALSPYSAMEYISTTTK